MGYHVALFIHLLALVAAACASGLTHFGKVRVHRADTAREALEWLRFTGSVARVFPIAVITLLATGGYMTAAGGLWTWSAGWIQAGATAAIFLFCAGPVMGIRSRKLGARLAALAASGHTPEQLAACSDPVVDTLSWVNSGVAIGAVFAMTVKPTAVGGFSAIAVGAVVGLVVSRMTATSHAHATEAASVRA